MKKVLTICIALVLVIAICGCSQSEQPSGNSDSQESQLVAEPTADEADSASEETDNTSDNSSEYKVGFVVMDYSNAYFVKLAGGFEERAKELGVEYSVVDGKMDVNTQINAIENFITSGMDAIICAPIDFTALEPYVKKAHDNGVVFLSEGEMIEGSDAFITIPEYEFGLVGGRNAGQWMKDNLEGPIEVAILEYPQIKSLIDRAKGLEDGILELYPDAQIVARQSAIEPDEGMEVTEAIMQANPNVKVIVGVNDGGALGAYQAVKAMGKATDDFGIFGLDANDEAVELIKQNTIYRGTVDTKSFERGALDLDTAIKVIEEGPIEASIEVPTYPLQYKDLAED